MAMTRSKWEITNRARELVLGALRDNPDDQFTTAEIFAGIVDTEITNTIQAGVILKFAAQDGLVTRETGHTAREIVWRITPEGMAWKPEPYDWKRSRNDKIKAQAPAISSQGDLRPQNAHKPAANHPFQQPAVSKTKKPAPVTRPLPVHLESKPMNYADLRLAKIEAALNGEDPPAAISIANEPQSTPHPEDAPMPGPCPNIDLTNLLPAESHEDESPASTGLADNLHWREEGIAYPPHPCQGHCANHARASQDVEDEAERLMARETEQAKKDYIIHLLTIADEHAGSGDDLGCSPVWKTARRLAPIFGLEKTYA